MTQQIEELPVLRGPQRITPEEAWLETRVILAKNIGTADGKQEAYLAFHEKFKGRFLTEPASIKSHHAFCGGYILHIHEVLQNAILLRDNLNLSNEQPTREDTVIAAYVHDLDKLLYRYQLDEEKPSSAQLNYARDLGIRIDPTETKSSISVKIDAAKNHTAIDATRIPRHTYNEEALHCEDSGLVAFFCAQEGLPINLLILHAVSVHHGGWSALARTNNKLDLKTLGVILHAADLISSQAQNGEVTWNLK